jgi:hypothetical protein
MYGTLNIEILKYRCVRRAVTDEVLCCLFGFLAIITEGKTLWFLLLRLLLRQFW